MEGHEERIRTESALQSGSPSQDALVPPVGQLDTYPRDLLPLAPAIVKVWTIKSSLAVAGLTLSAAVFDVVRLVTGRTESIPFGIATLGVVVVGGLLAYFTPRLRYKYWRYVLLDEQLVVQHGIINRIHTIVPLRRIQHLDVSQDIVEREYELGKLIVHTAGTRSSDVIVPGLSITEANRLRDLMKNYILEDAV